MAFVVIPRDRGSQRGRPEQAPHRLGTRRAASAPHTSHRTDVDVGASIGLFRRLELSFAMPFTVYQGTQNGAAIDPTLATTPSSGASEIGHGGFR